MSWNVTTKIQKYDRFVCMGLSHYGNNVLQTEGVSEQGWRGRKWWELGESCVIWTFTIHIYQPPPPIPVAVRSTARVCGLSPNMKAGSNPAGAWMSVSCASCVVWKRFLRRVHHSSSGVLPTVVCLECDCGTSTTSRCIPTRVVEPRKLKTLDIYAMYFSPHFLNITFPVNGVKFSCLQILFPFCLYCSIMTYLYSSVSYDDLENV